MLCCAVLCCDVLCCAVRFCIYICSGDNSSACGGRAGARARTRRRSNPDHDCITVLQMPLRTWYFIVHTQFCCPSLHCTRACVCVCVCVCVHARACLHV